MNFNNQTVVIVGGSSGIGFAVAKMVVATGGKVILGGRNLVKLQFAARELGANTTFHQIDTTEQNSIINFFEHMPKIDHLFTPGASYSMGPIDKISDEVAESPLKSKFWGQYWSVKHALPKLHKDSSVVLMSGAASVRPLKFTAAYAAANSAVEGLGRALALELSPIRVNTISPGTVNSDLWQNRDKELRNFAFDMFSSLNIIGRVATVEEIAQSVCFLMSNTNMTGNTLFADGGYAIR